MITASAPGKLMLMGEHAVLHGRLALVAAVDQRMRVELSPRSDDVVTISSELGEWQGTLQEIGPVAPFHFVLDAIRQQQSKTGFDLRIVSDFRDDVGLGSSSAVTVATVAALMRSHDDRQQIFQRSLDVVRRVQGMASGADLAAAVFGGTVAYRVEPLEIRPLSQLPPIVAVYSGSKMKTAEVIELVEEQRLQSPAEFGQIFAAMEACAEKAIPAIEAGDWPSLGALFNEHHTLMQRIGISNETLDNIAESLRNQPDIHGAKISGAGLGDCVIGVGDANDIDVLDLRLADQGVQVTSG